MLKGKTIVITGCASGIGWQTMETFAKNGADVIACVIEETPEFIKKAAGLKAECMTEIHTIAFNFADEQSIKEAMKKIVALKLPIDALINIAGITYNALFHMTAMDKFREVMQIDFDSQMLVTQTISKLMLRQKKGSIVFISSTTGLDGNSGQTAYSAAKAALIGAMKTLAIELGIGGIRVNAVAPGVIETPMTKALTDEQFGNLVKKTMLKRAAKPEEVSNVLMWLASDLSAYVTGQVIRIDGGM